MKVPTFGSGRMGLDFFTLEDVAERMSHLLGEKITPQTLLDYGVLDKSDLVFSVYVHNWFLFKKIVDANGVVSVTRESLDGLVDLHRWTIKELRTSERVEVTWVRACDGARACAVSTHHWGHDPESWRAVFTLFPGSGEPTFPWVSRSDLRIRRSELERLELLFKPTAPQVPSDENPQPSDGKDQGIPEQPMNSEPAQSIADLAKEDAAQKLTRADTWKLRAKELANELDPWRETQNINVLARQIHQRLKEEGLTNRNHKTPAVDTIERDILRGWKSTK